MTIHPTGKSFNELLKTMDSLVVNLQLTGRDFTTLDASSLDLDLDSLGLNFDTEGGVDCGLGLWTESRVGIFAFQRLLSAGKRW